MEPTDPLAAPLPEVTEPLAAEPEPSVPQVTEPEIAAPQTPEAAPETEGALPRLTEFAAALPETAPRARPTDFTAELERRRYGGRTRTELAEVRPRSRPASAQTEAIAARDAAPEATTLAIDTSPAPRGRPDDFDAIVAVAIVQKQAERVTASLDYQTPNTNAAIEAALKRDQENIEMGYRIISKPGVGGITVKIGCMSHQLALSFAHKHLGPMPPGTRYAVIDGSVFFDMPRISA